MRLSTYQKIPLAVILMQCCAIGTSTSSTEPGLKNESSLRWLADLRSEIVSEVAPMLRCFAEELEDWRSSAGAFGGIIQPGKRHDYQAKLNPGGAFEDLTKQIFQQERQIRAVVACITDEDEEEEVRRHSKQISVKGRKRKRGGYLMVPVILGLFGVVIATIIGIIGLVAGKALALSSLALVIALALSSKATVTEQRRIHVTEIIPGSTRGHEYDRMTSHEERTAHKDDIVYRSHPNRANLR